MKQAIKKKEVLKKPSAMDIMAKMGMKVDVNNLETSNADKPMDFIPLPEAFENAVKLPGIPQGYTTIITGWSNKQAGMIYLSLRQNSAKKEVAEMSGTSIQNVRNVLSVAKESLIKKYIERNAEIITAHIKNQES